MLAFIHRDSDLFIYVCSITEETSGRCFSGIDASGNDGDKYFLLYLDMEQITLLHV